jgi:uroporphyrinogen-III decarboxylase
MDIVEIRKKYGSQVSLMGGINKYALLGSREDIRNELEYKICGITKGGGTIFALDHRVPNGVPIENYRYYVNLGRELLGREPLKKI